jgi:hypothetical protein
MANQFARFVGGNAARDTEEYFFSGVHSIFLFGRFDPSTLLSHRHIRLRRRLRSALGASSSATGVK